MNETIQLIIKCGQLQVFTSPKGTYCLLDIPMDEALIFARDIQMEQQIRDHEEEVCALG